MARIRSVPEASRCEATSRLAVAIQEVFTELDATALRSECIAWKFANEIVARGHFHIDLRSVVRLSRRWSASTRGTREPPPTNGDYWMFRYTDE